MLPNKFFIFFIFLLTSCISNISHHGVLLKEKEVQKIKKGTSLDVVAGLLGTPSIVTKRDKNDIFIYIDYKRNKRPILKKYFTQHNVLEFVIAHNKVIKINQFDKKDLQKISFNKHKTKIKTRKQSIFTSFFENFGKFSETDSY